MAMRALSIPLDLELVRGFDKNLVFIDEVIDWFILNNITPPIPYFLSETAVCGGRLTTFTLMVSFENDGDALLFKLRWL